MSGLALGRLLGRAVALQAFLHFANATLEGLKFVGLSLNGLLAVDHRVSSWLSDWWWESCQNNCCNVPLDNLLVEVGNTIFNAKNVHELRGERAGNSTASWQSVQQLGESSNELEGCGKLVRTIAGGDRWEPSRGRGQRQSCFAPFRRCFTGGVEESGKLKS